MPNTKTQGEKNYMTDAEKLKIKIEETIVDLDPREKYNLEQLGKKLQGVAVTPNSLAKMLPEAFDDSGEQGPALASAMTPLTETAIDISVQKDPEILATALFPVIGGAIRKAMANLVAEIMENMNSGLESVFSFKRLSWRFEAWKTGKSFLEIMLSHTMEYSVDHVFLIHKNTGLLLHSLSRKGITTADDDMVGSMLTVIQQYIKDSLKLDHTDTVQGIKAGNYSILVEDGPRASLALIVSGTPESSLRSIMQKTLESVHIKLAGPLKTFRGNISPFEKQEKLLEPCLINKLKDGTKKKPVFAIIFVSLLALIASFFIAKTLYVHINENKLIRAIDAEDGVVVVSTKRGFNKVYLSILRDAKARPIQDLLKDYNFLESHFVIIEEAFYSPHFSTKPDSIRQIPEHLLEIARRIAQYSVFFEQDSGELAQGQEEALIEIGKLVQYLVEESKKEGFTAMIEITGHAAGNIQDEASIRISEERAQKALHTFIGINEPLIDYVKARGVGVLEPVVQEEKTEQDREKNRTVTFKAVFQ